MYVYNIPLKKMFMFVSVKLTYLCTSKFLNLIHKSSGYHRHKHIFMPAITWVLMHQCVLVGS